MSAAQQLLPEHTTKIALLEQSAINISETLKDLKSEIRDFRNDHKIEMKEFHQEIKDVRQDVTKEYDSIRQRSWVQFSFIFSLIAGLFGIIAKAEGWF